MRIQTFARLPQPADVVQNLAIAGAGALPVALVVN